MVVKEIQFQYWGNRVRVKKETPKAVCLEVHKTYCPDTPEGVWAWFPKSVLEQDPEYTGEGLWFVKEWFVRKGLTQYQARVLGQCD